MNAGEINIAVTASMAQFNATMTAVKQSAAATATSTGELLRNKLRDAKAIEMSHKDAMRAAQEAREEARRSSSLVMHCFNLSGAAMVLAACCDDAEAFLAAVEISDASMHAIAALGVDVDRYKEAAAAANPL